MVPHPHAKPRPRIEECVQRADQGELDLIGANLKGALNTEFEGVFFLEKKAKFEGSFVRKNEFEGSFFF